MPADPGGAGAAQGLAWSWQLDFGALVRCLGDDGSSDAGVKHADPAQDAVLDDLDERGGERIPAGMLAGRVAEQLAPGPDLVAWLALAPDTALSDGDLAAVAGSWRRVAAWAQARELAAVAQIASRAAARDEDIGTDADGRPARISAAAAAEVALELTMSQYAATGWADLAVDLTWRLAATGAVLAAGKIDLSRARLIAEATAMLSDEAARAVQEKVLPAAADMTTGALRAALRRAVMATDPRGAEERRKEAERQAKVSLYPDEGHTAALAGQRLPAVHAAAAMARIRAMARALKASGASGRMDLLCAQIYLGLLLGTLPPIPPAEDAPPDPGDDGYDDDPPGGGPPAGTRPGNGSPRGSRRDGSPGDGQRNGGPQNSGRQNSGPADDVPADDVPADDVPADDVPPPGDQDAPRDDEDYPCFGDGIAGGDWAGGDWDQPGRDNWDHPGWDNWNHPGWDDDDSWSGGGPAPDWPGLPAVIPPGFARSGDGPASSAGGFARSGGGLVRSGAGLPASGMLDVSMPWRTLAGISAEPGRLGRIGPVTAAQARWLAEYASRDPATEWRIIVTAPGGQAIAVTRIPRPRERGSPPSSRAGPAKSGAGAGLVSRVTLTIPEDILAQPQDLLAQPPQGPGTGSGPDPDPGPPGGILARALRAVAEAAARAQVSAEADAAVGGCAHGSASAAYRPPPRLKEYIAARDLTCRFPTCRQPAWRGDLDHTIPFEKGGLTCRCNLGGLCRTHHQVKQHLYWHLEQTAPGIFRWTTPAGRTFAATPDVHPV